MPMKRRFLLAVCAGIAALVWSAQTPTLAGEADVVEVVARQAGDRTWRFDVTVSHADEGWDHYADLWEVVAPDGTVLGQRVLAHPHVDEQPFTRSLSGVEIPAGTGSVEVRARDSVHGFGGRSVLVDLD
jgi:predicted nucleotidyltransferase